MDTRQHHRPHLHVEYQGKQAVIAIPEGDVLDGDLPTKKLRLVQAWIAIHEDELMADWALDQARVTAAVEGLTSSDLTPHPHPSP